MFILDGFFPVRFSSFEVKFVYLLVLVHAHNTYFMFSKLT